LLAAPNSGLNGRDPASRNNPSMARQTKISKGEIFMLAALRGSRLLTINTM